MALKGVLRPHFSRAQANAMWETKSSLDVSAVEVDAQRKPLILPERIKDGFQKGQMLAR